VDVAGGRAGKLIDCRRSIRVICHAAVQYAPQQEASSGLVAD